MRMALNKDKSLRRPEREKEKANRNKAHEKKKQKTNDNNKQVQKVANIAIYRNCDGEN